VAPVPRESNADDAGPVLEFRGLQKIYAGHRVLRGIDFAVQRGERVCVLGPSGSGKTTLLRCTNLLTEPTAGSLFFKGTSVGQWPARGRSDVNVREYRSHIGMVFQHFELFPHLTALENVVLGPIHVRKLPHEHAKERGYQLLKRVGLAEKVHAYPATLSGGQQQRVAIARALAMDPAVILFDEPTSALDPEMVAEVLDLMTALALDGMTMVIVTHETGFARRVADRLLIVDDGLIIEEGPPALVFESPTHQRTQEILAVRMRD
jgi:ABC-type polar amino acid transport system ATPase subunit